MDKERAARERKDANAMHMVTKLIECFRYPEGFWKRLSARKLAKITQELDEAIAEALSRLGGPRQNAENAKLGDGEPAPVPEHPDEEQVSENVR